MLQVPMRETIAITIGNPLTIAFTEDCCFCCEPDQVNNFNPPLPRGDRKSGDNWTGIATKAGTINFHHDTYGTDLSKKHELKGGGSRSIQVGE